MKTVDEMMKLNQRQAEFYDGVQQAEANAYAANSSANLATRAWASLREQQHQAVKRAGIFQLLEATFTRWFEERRGGRFLEIGPFMASEYTFKAVEIAGEYVGIELSTAAAEGLNGIFKDRGLADKASVRCGDFLALEEPAGFDVVYAHGVLHHFQNADALFDRIAKLLKPDGLLLFVEPCDMNPVFRAARRVYRPFQSDAEWEWPFRENTVAALTRHFNVAEAHGWGRMSLPLSLACALPLAGPLVAPLYRRCVIGEYENAGKLWRNSRVAAKCVRANPMA